MDPTTLKLHRGAKMFVNENQREKLKRDRKKTLLLYRLRLMKKVRQKQQENTMRCNNHDDLLQLSFTLKISIFSGAYIEPSQTSIAKTKPLSIFTKKLYHRCLLGF